MELKKLIKALSQKDINKQNSVLFLKTGKKEKLEDVLEFKNGINAKKEQYGKGVKFINVLDILNNNYITYESIIDRVDIDNDILDNNKVGYGDILFQRS